MSKEEEDKYSVWMSMMKDMQILPYPSTSAEPKLTDLLKEDYETRWNKAFRKITLLRIMNRITDKEVGRLVSLMESEDSENWTIAEECIKQKFSEL